MTMGELRIENLARPTSARRGWNTARTLRVFDDISFSVARAANSSASSARRAAASRPCSTSRPGSIRRTGGTVSVDGARSAGPASTAAWCSRNSRCFPGSLCSAMSSSGCDQGLSAAEARCAARRNMSNWSGSPGFETIIRTGCPAACASASAWPRAGDRACGAADGRAVRRARRADARSMQRHSPKSGVRRARPCCSSPTISARRSIFPTACWC